MGYQRASQTKNNQTTPTGKTVQAKPTPLATHSPVHPLLKLQSIIGNQAVNRLIQTKMQVGEPDDVYEKEADTVAAQVMRMPAPPVQNQTEEEDIQTKPIALQLQSEEEEIQTKPIALQLQSEEEEIQTKPIALQLQSEEEEIQTKANPGQTPQVSPNLETKIQSRRGTGQLLSESIRSFMEPRFGADFSNVRVHTDSSASQMSKELGAQAFTHRSDIYFGEGKSPGNNELTAHELTHVVQQNTDVQRKDSGVQRQNQPPIHNSQPGIQRAGPLAVPVAWATLGSTGFTIAHGTLTQGSSDLTYSFDEMNGTKLYGNDQSYKTKHKYPIRAGAKKIAVWTGTKSSRKLGLKFQLDYLHDGYSLGNISMRLLDTYDWPAWGGSVRVNLTPLDFPGTAKVRVTCNVAASRTFASSVAGSEVFYLSANNKLAQVGNSSIWQEYDP
ncbi:DUF4157 domain-containing protein [Moorena sp. SIO3I8]|uniref:eCIS core domain-containing protein n=1 Tax=Moorena sp. SIO3I8 TaxID=2607833 RepID=UPI0025CD1068|nr:DUF4157 domain-containing protein [Moorena sp. SIO3I8]